MPCGECVWTMAPVKCVRRRVRFCVDFASGTRAGMFVLLWSIPSIMIVMYFVGCTRDFSRWRWYFFLSSLYVEHYSLAVVSSPTHVFTQKQTYMYTWTCTQAIPSCEFQIPNFVAVCVTQWTNCKWWANSFLYAGPCASAFIRSCANLVHRSHLLNMFCYNTTKISIN